MKINDYINNINIDICPEKCEFVVTGKSKAIAHVIPPINDILGIIISRDPTIAWLSKYKEAMSRPEDLRRKILFDTAIPAQLIQKIKTFMKDKISDEKSICLSEMIYKRVYWTHLHKCFTDKGRESIPFKKKNAKECANRWLIDELDIAIDEQTKFIIALGIEVKEWISDWRGDYNKLNNIDIIYLPHPSPANVGKGFSWYPSKSIDRDKLEKRVERLITYA